MRLNADLIARSPTFFNALKDREIDLRGNKIAMIENLAALQNQFDSIDLSDNEIRKLECMAVLPRLKMLILSNNRISRIAERLSNSFPNLETLVLINNQLATLKDLEPISSLHTLTNLSLVDNPVSKQPTYRAFLIARLPKLHALDFQRVTEKERAAAEREFSAASATPAAAVGGGTSGSGARAAPTAEQIALIKQAIADATSLDEVARLEKLLKAADYDAIERHLAGSAAASTNGGIVAASGDEPGAEAMQTEDSQGAAPSDAPAQPEAPPQDMET